MKKRVLPADLLLLGTGMLTVALVLCAFVQDSESMQGSVVDPLPYTAVITITNPPPLTSLSSVESVIPVDSSESSSAVSVMSAESVSSTASSALDVLPTPPVTKPVAPPIVPPKKKITPSPKTPPPTPHRTIENTDSLRSALPSLDKWMLAMSTVFAFLEQEHIPISDAIHASHRATAALYRTDRDACLKSVDACWQLQEILTRIDHMQVTIDDALVAAERNDLRWTVYHMLQ